MRTASSVASATTDTLPGVEIRVARHYEGPPGMTNGGWACGLAAGLLTGPDTPPGTAVEVTLRAPVPLDTPIRGERSGDSAFLVGVDPAGDGASPAGPDRSGDGALVQARLLTAEERAALVPPPAFVPLAAARHAGSPDVCVRTPFPTCYVCGPDREGGLHITIGPVATGGSGGGGAVATGGSAGVGAAAFAGVWAPPSALGDLPLRYLWAALDCPTGLVHLTGGGKALLGRLTMVPHRAPVRGEPLVVVAAATGSDRRKRFATAALYTPDAELVAQSVATWITI
ncbi:hypothetical protein [Virgisporangium ochraceum]|uniref:Thioesterase family protein n=1 Tax=Virgisporangium ochraceum TaxID=65505 RepID=A0A8J3ZNS3_9ACTN|nr:hypothetical protein [Virgisporangium ochraceum]GIJ67397.1 hypothetical protein Voc01_023140 [Virgisporangium ochraceum]